MALAWGGGSSTIAKLLVAAEQALGGFVARLIEAAPSLDSCALSLAEPSSFAGGLSTGTKELPVVCACSRARVHGCSAARMVVSVPALLLSTLASRACGPSVSIKHQFCRVKHFLDSHSFCAVAVVWCGCMKRCVVLIVF